MVKIDKNSVNVVYGWSLRKHASELLEAKMMELTEEVVDRFIAVLVKVQPAQAKLPVQLMPLIIIIWAMLKQK